MVKCRRTPKLGTTEFYAALKKELMINHLLPDAIFITYGERSATHYWRLCGERIRKNFGIGPFATDEEIRVVYLDLIDFLAKEFIDIIHGEDDTMFSRYLFANHESSLKILMAFRDGELEGVDENTLSLNRRILKLALEQCCDMNYTAVRPLSVDLMRYYVSKVEDLMYIGYLLYHFADSVAEIKLLPQGHILEFEKDGRLLNSRIDWFEAVYTTLHPDFDKGFEYGVFDRNYAGDLRAAIQRCMGINYDLAGGMIFEIKRHHAPKNADFQTVEPGILVENLVRAFGVEEEKARAFYDGLTISRHNKLSLKEAIYQPHSTQRYLSRPILILYENGKQRALVGAEKWMESMFTMGVNGFQWRFAPEEWMTIDCFRDFINQKAEEHDKLLEEPVGHFLKDNELMYDRNVKSLIGEKGQGVRIEIKDVGEMDFVVIDSAAKKILVIDCKYNKSRYESVGFMRDHDKFVGVYETKIRNKVDWVKANILLVETHFKRKYPQQKVDLTGFAVQPLFVINTPTFYMQNGGVDCVTVQMLPDHWARGWKMKPYIVKYGSKEITITHPYYRFPSEYDAGNSQSETELP